MHEDGDPAVEGTSSSDAASPADLRSARAARDRDRQERGVAYRMFGIGYMSATEAIAGLLLGAGVDWVVGSSPWGLMVGGFLGVAVGMWSLVRRSLHLQQSLGSTRKSRAGAKATSREGLGDESGQ